MGTDEKKLGRTIVRINAIESTSPLASADNLNESTLPAVLVPSEPEQPDTAYEREEISERVRKAIASLPPREQRVISLYYYAEATMKQIGAEIGVNESRVSQLHARAIRRLRDALGDMNPQKVAEMRHQLIAFAAKPAMAKANLVPLKADATMTAEKVAPTPAVVLPYKRAAKKPAPVKALKVSRQNHAVAAAR